MASFDGVELGSFVAQVRGIKFSGVRACRRESVVVGRRPDNVHDVWHSRLSTAKHSNTPCLRHTDVVFIGQLKLVNISFSNLALLQLFYKYTCIAGFHTEGGVPWDIPPPKVQFSPPKNFISQCHNESN